MCASFYANVGSLIYFRQHWQMTSCLMYFCSFIHSSPNILKYLSSHTSEALTWMAVVRKGALMLNVALMGAGCQVQINRLKLPIESEACTAELPWHSQSHMPSDKCYLTPTLTQSHISELSVTSSHGFECKCQHAAP